MEFRFLYLILLICMKLSESRQLSNSDKDIDVFKDVAKKLMKTDKNFKKNRSQKIVGGQPAIEHIAPWMVSLQWGTRVKIHFCGGTIITPDWVLTAGHCLQTQKTMRLEVVAGLHDLKKNESLTEQRRFIWRVFIHPNFKGGVGANDIGLIQVKSPFRYTSTVGELKLPTKWTSEDGEATLYGWGSMSRTRFPINPNILQTMTAPIISNAQCKRQVLNYGSIVRDSNICTDSVMGRISSCNGDSGSALIKDETIIGIVSWGLKPCGLPNSASVYTRVSSYLDWISKIIHKDDKSQLTFDF